MRFGRYLAVAAAAMLTSAPVMAAPIKTAPANPAASLSLAKNLRTSSHASHKSELIGLPLIIAIVASVAVAVSVVIVASDNNSDSN